MKLLKRNFNISFKGGRRPANSSLPVFKMIMIMVGRPWPETERLGSVMWADRLPPAPWHLSRRFYFLSQVESVKPQKSPFWPNSSCASRFIFFFIFYFSFGFSALFMESSANANNVSEHVPHDTVGKHFAGEVFSSRQPKKYSGEHHLSIKSANGIHPTMK